MLSTCLEALDISRLTHKCSKGMAAHLAAVNARPIHDVARSVHVPALCCPLPQIRLIVGTTCTSMPLMHRRSTTQSLRASSSPDVASFRQPEKPGEADFAWFQCGCWLVAGGLLPSLLACYYYKEVETYHLLFFRVESASIWEALRPDSCPELTR